MSRIAATTIEPLSDEQRRAVALASRGSDGAVVARAGSGKTHTLRAIARTTAPTSTLLLAFNRSIAAEARARLPEHVQVTTMHALAYRAVVARDPRMRRKFAATSRPDQVALWTRLAELDPRDPKRGAHVAAIRALLAGFAASADPLPSAEHLPAGMRRTLDAQLGTDRAVERTRWLARRAARIWQRSADPDDSAPLDHDGYLKLFDLRRCKLEAELVLVDEAQDLAPVMLSVLARQAAVRILVGDPAQRIYGWRGAVDAMAASGYPQVRLTRSFRFGPEIAAVALRVLQLLAPGSALVGAGPSGAVDVSDRPATGPRAILCRSNLGVIEAALANAERGVSVVGGFGATLDRLEASHVLWRRRDQPATEVSARASQDRAATVAGFASWRELCDAAEVEGGPVRTLQRLVDRHGDEVPRICRLLGRAELRKSSVNAPLQLSTVHRAKGREWDRIELWGDLPRLPCDALALRRAPDPEASRAEANLLYVAVTRARRALHLGRLSDDLIELLVPAAAAQASSSANACRATW